MTELPFITIFMGVLLLISLIIGFIRGVKRGFYSLLSNIASIILAFGLTKIIILILSKRGLAPIGEKVLNTEFLRGIVSVQDLAVGPKFVGTIVTSICLFYGLYLLFLLISQMVKRAIFNKVTRVYYSKYNVLFEKKWYMKILAMLISVASCAATCYCFTFGIVAISGAIDKGFEGPYYSKKPYEISIVEKDYATPIIRKCFADKTFNLLTSMHDSEFKTTTTTEITQGIKLINAISNIDDENEIENNLDRIEEAIKSTVVVPEIAARAVIDKANEITIYTPKKGEKGFEARLLRLENSVLLAMKSTNKNNIRENTETFISIGKEIADKKAYKITEYDELIELLKDKEFVENLFVDLFKNPNTQNVMGSLIDLCVGSVFDNLNIDVKETYIFSLDYDKLSTSEVKREANIISIFADNYEIIQKLARGESIEKEELEKIKEDLDIIKNCEIITSTIYDTINGFVKNFELTTTPDTTAQPVGV